ncbi:MAG: AMP-binding protein, partial [Planctomycetota bacterium]
MQVKLIHQWLECQSAERPKTTLVKDPHQDTSYAETDRRANALAQLLVEQGIERGDRVGLLAANSSEYVAAYYGILKAGAVVVPLNASADNNSCRALLRLCEASGLVCGRRMGRRARGVEQLERVRFVLGWASDWAERFQKNSRCRFLDQAALSGMDCEPPRVSLTPRDRAAIVYTSGSTGSPKGVTLTHANIVANVNSI